MDTITALYNMFERFLPSAKSNLHVLRQKVRDFYNNLMKKKYRKEKCVGVLRDVRRERLCCYRCHQLFHNTICI